MGISVRPPKVLESFDAREWAKAFLQHAHREQRPSRYALNEGVLVAWFANALMRGYDQHRSLHGDQKPVVEFAFESSPQVTMECDETDSATSR